MYIVFMMNHSPTARELVRISRQKPFLKSWNAPSPGDVIIGEHFMEQGGTGQIWGNAQRTDFLQLDVTVMVMEMPRVGRTEFRNEPKG
jgi:hypothetical protein